MEVIYVTSGWKHLFAGLDFHLSVARVMAHIDKDLVERAAYEGCLDWQRIFVK